MKIRSTICPTISTILPVFLFLILSTAKAQFTPGNIVVLQAGDGSTTLANTGNAILLKEYNSSGVSTYSVGITTSTASGNPLIISGSASSEGGLSLTPNGKYLVFTGYAQNLPGASSLSGGTSATYNRGVGIVNASGSYSRIASSATFYSANNIRSATSDGNDNYWSAGANDGTNYFGTVSTATTVQNQNTNTRYISIFSGNLYFSASSGTLQGIAKVGTGLPVVSGQTTSSIIAIGTGGSPYAFYFNSSQSICYVADDRAPASGGGIQKWVYSSSTWSLAYTLGTGATTGARGVIADFSGPNPIVYATTAESSANRLISIVDAGALSTSTTLATSVTNSIFRGISFAPYCTAPQITSVTSNSVICANQALNLDVNVTGTATYSYTWAGSGSFNSASVKTPTVTGAASGNYSVTVSNGCGTATSAISVTVNPLPTIVASPSVGSVCIGQQITLNASGANTYTWSNGISDGIAFSPTASLVYTVTGANLNSCSNSATVTITVNPLPTVTVNSAVICAGQTASLIASGASSYTWNVGGNSASITPSPSLTTTYTVNGALVAGCISSATTEITVFQNPTLSINSGSICAGDSFTLTVSGATSYTWDGGSNAPQRVVTPTVTTVYTVTGNDSGCTINLTGSVVVNSLPTISVNSSTICVGSSATLVSSGASSYTWNIGSNSNSIVPSPSVSTTYTIQGASSFGCVNSNTTLVTVNTNPTVTANSATLCLGGTATLIAIGAASYTWNTNAFTSSIVVTPSASIVYTVTGSILGCMSNNTATITVNSLPAVSVNSSTICIGNSASLTATGASSYTWSTGSNSTSIITSPTINTSYTTTGTSSLGCINTATAQIVVNSLPTITVNSATICNGSTATLTAGGANSYTWNTTSNSGSITPSPSVTLIYTVNGSNSAGCVNTLTTQILVNPNPTISVNSVTLCTGASATITATGASSYTWNTSVFTSSIVVTPSASIVYTVTGSTLGCLSNSTATITVNSLPAVSVNSSAICIGNSASLTATGASSYTWNTGSNSTSITVSPTINTSYTATGTSSLGCINTATVQIVVNSLPTITVNSATICNGSTATLTVGGATSYTWNTTSNSGSITPSPSVTSIYTVNGANSAGCISTLTTQILVNPNPTISLNSPTLCAGNTTTLTAGGASSYTWSSGPTTSSVVVTPTATIGYTVYGSSLGCITSNTNLITVNPLPTVVSSPQSICTGGTGTLIASGASSYSWNTGSNSNSITASPATSINYTITGTSSLGCTNSTTTSIIVSSSPSITVNPATICAGSSTIITASGISTYTWNTSANTSSINVAPLSTTVYTVTGNAPGCSVIASNTVAVIVNPLPILTVNSATICFGSSAILISGGANTYTWSTNMTGSSITVIPASTTVFVVLGTLNGCISSNTATVTVSPLPALTINSATICLGNTAMLTANGANTYSWNVGPTTQTITVNPVTNTVYIVSGSSAQGCINSATALVTVLSLPSLTFSLNNLVVCRNDGPIALAAQPAGGIYTGSGISGNTFNPFSSGTGTFFVTYTYTDLNSCSNSVSKTFTVGACTGIEEVSKNNRVTAWPNPVKSELNLSLENISDNCKVEVFNLSGDKLYTAIPEENITTIEMKNYPKGLYVVKITSNGNCSVLKIIKE